MRQRKARIRNDGSGGAIKRALTPEALRDLYVTHGLTMAEIARSHRCSRQYVSLLCRQHGIRRQDRPRSARGAS